MKDVKVIAFDVFGTVFDFSQVPKQEIREYVRYIKSEPWKPLKLPSSWEQLPPFPDSVEGIEELRKHYTVVTCSNGPLGTLAKLSKNGNVRWDAIIPLELKKVYKPNPEAYLTVCEVLDVKPEHVLMVTANKTFGDLEAAKSIGMKAKLIRDPNEICPDNIIDLAYLMKLDNF